METKERFFTVSRELLCLASSKVANLLITIRRENLAIVACTKHNLVVSQLVLCLSRACLGKVIVFSRIATKQRRHKGVLRTPHGSDLVRVKVHVLHKATTVCTRPVSLAAQMAWEMDSTAQHSTAAQPHELLYQV
eukprot:COSAG06_NODE_405_length_16132_cov_9.166532_20_plen_135_part_00